MSDVQLNRQMDLLRVKPKFCCRLRCVFDTQPFSFSCNLDLKSLVFMALQKLATHIWCKFSTKKLWGAHIPISFRCVLNKFKRTLIVYINSWDFCEFIYFFYRILLKYFSAMIWKLYSYFKCCFLYLSKEDWISQKLNQQKKY